VEYLETLGLTCGARVGLVAILLEHPTLPFGQNNNGFGVVT